MRVVPRKVGRVVHALFKVSVVDPEAFFIKVDNDGVVRVVEDGYCPHVWGRIGL